MGRRGRRVVDNNVWHYVLVKSTTTLLENLTDDDIV